MIIRSKRLLLSGSAYCTLIVSTTPSAATCTLEYDGVSHSAKSATVPVGTVITYTITDSTYGTKTDSIIMDSDKTLIATGTYSETPVESSWTRATLSSNGTMSGSSPGCTCSSKYSNPAYYAFDGKTGGASYGWASQSGKTSGWLRYYSPKAVRATSCKITAISAWGFKSVTVYGSNSETSGYEQLATYTGSSKVTSSKSLTLSSGSNYYKYFQFSFSNPTSGTGATVVGVEEITFSGYYVSSTAYSYYWDVVIS